MSDEPPASTGLDQPIASPARVPASRPRPKVRDGRRVFRGFAVFDHAGSMIWGTLRPEAEASRSAFGRWNPAVSGIEQGETVRRVTIIIEPQKPA